MLMEVVISALLVGLIVVATLTGFDVVNRVTADQRRHNEASLLAAQSQEQLRSDPATTLDALESNPHVFTRTVGGTVFTITQTSKPVNSSGTATGCNATETKSKTSTNILITSTVTWPTLTAAKRPAVVQSSLITPPTGSALEVDVTNGAAPPTPVSGITAYAKYIPAEGGGQTTVEGTTGSEGCVVFSALPTTLATVEIAEKPGYVTTSGALKYPTKEWTIAPNITVHDPVTYAPGGRITAEFTYKGATVWEGHEVKSDTFVAYNSTLPAPSYQVGSTTFEYEAGGEERYTALTSKFGAVASTAAGVRYPAGDLFPFPGAWAVYAGDCTKNKTGAEAVAEGKVEAATTTVLKVPMSYVALNVYAGTQASPGALESTSYPVKITNPECEPPVVPNNALAASTAHLQVTSTTGHLEYPFQPFGKAALCVYSKTTKRTYRVSYTNTTAAGSSAKVYIGEPSVTEKEETRKTEEATAKATRETEEKTARTNWENEEKAKKITNTQRKEKEATQTTARKTAEAAEVTLRNERVSKEAEEVSKKEVTVASGQASC